MRVNEEETQDFTRAHFVLLCWLEKYRISKHCRWVQLRPRVGTLSRAKTIGDFDSDNCIL